MGCGNEVKHDELLFVPCKKGSFCINCARTLTRKVCGNCYLYIFDFVIELDKRLELSENTVVSTKEAKIAAEITPANVETETKELVVMENS